MARTRKKSDDQGKAFIETARKIGADEDRSAADMLIGRLAKMPPDPKPKPKSKAKPKKPAK